MTKKLLIIGGDSILGSRLSAYFKKNNIKHSKTSRKKNSKSIFLDLANIHNQKNIIERIINSFDIIIYCVSITSINECQKDPINSYFINVKQTLLLFSLIKKNIKVFYMSTSSVFDGHKKQCIETDSHLPLNMYGIQKTNIEKKILNKKNFTIIRISKVLSKNIIILMDWKAKINNNDIIFAYTNRFINPVSIQYFTKIIEHIIFRSRNKKIIHISNNKNISRYEFACSWFKHNNYNMKLLKPVLSEANYKQSNLIKNTNLNVTFKDDYTNGFL